MQNPQLVFRKTFQRQKEDITAGPQQGRGGGTMPRGGPFRGGGTFGEKKEYKMVFHGLYHHLVVVVRGGTFRLAPGRHFPMSGPCITVFYRGFSTFCFYLKRARYSSPISFTLTHFFAWFAKYNSWSENDVQLVAHRTPTLNSSKFRTNQNRCQKVFNRGVLRLCRGPWLS